MQLYMHYVLHFHCKLHEDKFNDFIDIEKRQCTLDLWFNMYKVIVQNVPSISAFPIAPNVEDPVFLRLMLRRSECLI